MHLSSRQILSYFSLSRTFCCLAEIGFFSKSGGGFNAGGGGGGGGGPGGHGGGGGTIV